MRIHKEFEDGDSCTVYLKDRFKKQEEREELWYRQAFGDLRNMMNVHLQFTPMPDQIPPKKYIFLAQVHYTMYPEMVEEFGNDKYPGNPNIQQHLMTLEEPEEGQLHEEYTLELELPYGDYFVKMVFKEKNKEGENL